MISGRKGVVAGRQSDDSEHRKDEDKTLFLFVMIGAASQAILVGRRHSRTILKNRNVPPASTAIAASKTKKGLTRRFPLSVFGLTGSAIQRRNASPSRASPFPE